MQIVRGLDQYRPDAPPSVVAQGTFDGIHLGHQAVIRTAVGRARALGVRPVAVTFEPNPLAVLRPAEAPPELLPLDERLERIAELGPEACLVIPFTVEFSQVEAEAYVRDVLLGLLRAREIVVGFNHAFDGDCGTPSLRAGRSRPGSSSSRGASPSTVAPSRRRRSGSPSRRTRRRRASWASHTLAAS
jgi:FAD synthase